MAKENTTSSRLGGSATYSIGGRRYQAEDISRLRPKTKEVHTVSGHEHDPRNSSKPIDNLSGKMRTGNDIEKVDSFSESWSPKHLAGDHGGNFHQEYLANPANHPIKTASHMASPIAPVTSGNVRTESQKSELAEDRAREQTSDYHKDSTYVPERNTVHNSAQHSANVSGAIRTGVETAFGSVKREYRREPEGLRSTFLSSTSAIKTETQLTKAAEIRVREQVQGHHKDGTYNPEKTTIHTAVHRSPSGTDGVKTGVGKNILESKTEKKSKGEAVINVRSAVSMAESQVLQSDDVGSDAVRGVIETTFATAGAFRTAQKAAEVMPGAIKGTAKTITKVGKGTYHVVDAGWKTTVTIANSAHLIHYGQFVPISRDALRILQSQAVASGLNKTLIASRVVKGARTVVAKARRIKTGAQVAKFTAIQGYHIVRGMTYSAAHIAVTKEMLQRAGRQTLRAVGRGVKAAAKVTGKGIVVGTKYTFTKVIPKTAKVVATKGIPKTAKMTKDGALTVAGMLTSSEDYAVAGVGHSITTGWTGVKTAVAGVKASHRTVKTSVKAAKKIVRGINFARQHGFRAAVKRTAEQIAKGVGNLLLTAVKALGMKLVIPLVIIAAAALVITSIINMPTTIISGIFGGTFSASDTGNEYHVRDYLLDTNTGVGVMNQKLAENIDNQIQTSKASYDIVRLYATTGNTSVIEPSYNGVMSVLPTVDELTNMLQPLFNSILLMDYQLSPTEAEANTLLETLHRKLYRLTSVASTEQCGQSLATGEGAVTVHDCGSVHALADCPNPNTGTHSTFTCSECDSYYYLCKGHKGALRCPYEEHSHAYGNYASECYTFDCNLMEHIHGDSNSSCYAKNCFLEEHTHKISSCFSATAQGIVLTCTLQVHTHGENCDGYTLVCPFTEHTHGYNDTCYSFTCSKPEHTHTEWVSKNSPGCYYTDMHNGELTEDCGNSDRFFRCTGYNYCDGHSVYSYTLNLDGVYALVAEYFTNPINELLTIPNRTEEQNAQLDNLQTYFEIFNEMMTQVSEEWGGGLSSSDLGGVQFVGGTRVGCQAVVDLAKSQIGQTGGQPYWSYYGFGGRVEWCGCFVHWCMRNTPEASSAWPDTANNAYCPTIANWFKDHNQWGDKNFTDLVPGDVILFDWEGDGVSDHIGIVIGHDGSKVYTVEGNSNDKVALRSYPIGSSVIYGYGLLNFGN